MTEQGKSITTRPIISKELEEWKSKGANLLLPSTHIEGLSEFHKPVIEVVQLSANPDDGDVYAHDNAAMGKKKKWRPTKQALMKLSVCAGVIWSVDQSRRIDNGADRNYIAYKAVGGIRKADGQPVFFSAEYDIDFEVMEEELRDSYQRKVENGTKSKDDGTDGWAAKMSPERRERWVEDCVKRDMIQKRKFKLRLCEAGAMNRVLRMLLGIKQAYTTEELSKPFVTMRIVFQPDYNDKDVRKQLVAAAIQNMTGIYGPKALDSEIRNAEAIDVTPVDPGDEEPPDGDGDYNANGDQGNGHLSHRAASEAESSLIDFQNADTFTQCKTITDLALKTGYGLQEYLTKSRYPSLEAMTPAKRAELFKYLLSLQKPKAADGPDDDCPF